MIVLFVAAAVAAILLGLVLGRSVRRQNRNGPVDGAGREWINVEDLTGPAITLAALLLAFMMVQTYSSYQRAEQHAATEAATVLAEHEAARFLTEPDRTTVRTDLVCYARAVAEREWPAMADGRSDPLAEHWEERLRSALVAAADHDQGRLGVSGLVDLEVDRTTSRRERIAEVEPAVPGALGWMVELTALTILVLLCVFTWHLRPLVRVILVGAVVTLVLMVVVGVRELDTPFSGYVALQPTAMRSTLTEVAGTSAAGGAALPCDRTGGPVGG
ncbi:MAG: DUF4239 domain-containing protein [Nocardioides sp.]|nr:DUF4239 domain-containing protein [Nocardioidaceae bacterium]MCB8955498.1 DUF4239 domain-containing protein [Nocardioides sp.]